MGTGGGEVGSPENGARPKESMQGDSDNILMDYLLLSHHQYVETECCSCRGCCPNTLKLRSEFECFGFGVWVWIKVRSPKYGKGSFIPSNERPHSRGRFDFNPPLSPIESL